MGFFDDLSKKASETYKNTAEKTSKLTKEMKLKSLMNENKSKIEGVYIEIGKKVYEKHLLDKDIDIKTDFVEEISKIDAYASEIEDIRMELLKLKNLKMCKVCASEISEDAKFCPKCGSVQEQTPANIESQPEVINNENSEGNENNNQNTSNEVITDNFSQESEQNDNSLEETSENINYETPTTEIFIKENGVVEVNNGTGFETNISAQKSNNVNYEFAGNNNSEEN